MVSVIIPTYNYGRFIADALLSVKNQSSADWECIIIDNGSIDNTNEVVAPFLEDQRFSYYKQDNKGVSHARNTGMQKAVGEFFLFLDADDLIEEKKIEESLLVLEKNPGIDLAYSDVRYFRSEERTRLFYNYSCNESYDKPWMKYISGRGLKLISEFLDGNLFVISAPVFRATIINQAGNFDESIGHNEDWDFWFRMVLADKTIQYIDRDKTRSLIRVHKTSASVNAFKMQFCGLKVLLKNATRVTELGLAEKLNKRIDEHVRLLETTLSRFTQHEFADSIKEIKADKDISALFTFKSNSQLMFKAWLKLKHLLKSK